MFPLPSNLIQGTLRLENSTYELDCRLVQDKDFYYLGE